MIRRISTKLVLAVLTAIALPFVAFSFYLNEQMAQRLTRNVVQQALLGLAKDLATQIDSFILERRRDVALLAGMPATRHALDEYRAEVGALRVGNGDVAFAPWDASLVFDWADTQPVPPVRFDFERHSDRATLSVEFSRFILLKGVYDVIFLVSDDGRLVTCSTFDQNETTHEAEYIARLFETDFGELPWFKETLSRSHATDEITVWPSPGDVTQLDHHVSPFRVQGRGARTSPARDYNLGFASPVYSDLIPGDVNGVLFALANWEDIQKLTDTSVVQDAFRGLVEGEREPSPYAWIWRADADTIIGHPNFALYNKSITRDVKLPQLTAAVRASETGWGLYPEYTFQGKTKNAAFKRCALPRGSGEPSPGGAGKSFGFGWVVGVGIDNDDIYATSLELQSLLLRGTAAVLLMAVGWTFVIARRTTEPILQLQQFTRRVAEGDLDARIAVRSKDELGALGHDFNQMTGKLKEQQERLIKAEKDAAWREMARQIAHDIKNPLTPILLSLDLLERARRDRADGLEGIHERTMELIRRQVKNLQEIAAEFYEFTGGHKPRIATVDVGEMIDEVLHLHDAWAVSLGVEIHLNGEVSPVAADPGKLRRVLINLVSNALQAMPEGGDLFLETSAREGQQHISVRDTGRGLAAEAREHLFEPYFTTKSEGTGLGLAISKQVMEQMGGEIDLHAPEEGPGTLATVRIPLAGVAPGSAVETDRDAGHMT